MSAVAHAPAVRWSGHVTATLPELATVRDRLAAALRRFGWDEPDTFRVLVCADEAAANALCHGSHAGDPITAAFRVTPRDATVSFSDSGSCEETVPDELPVPDPVSEHGRGLILMRILPDGLRIRRRSDGTTVEMTFHHDGREG